MKKAIILVMCVLLTSCSAVESVFGKKEEEQTAQVTTAVQNNYTAKETDTVVTGEVVSITGNEVTLALGELSANKDESDDGEMPSFGDGERPSFGDGEMPSFGDGERPSFGDGERPSFGDGEMPSFDDGERPSFGDGERPSFGDGEMPSFGDGERPSFGDGERPSFGDGERPSFGDSSSDSSDGSSRRPGRKRKSSASVNKSGEEQSFIIPVGMTIDGLSGRSSDYSGITAGTVLTLTINSDGVVCAASAN